MERVVRGFVAEEPSVSVRAYPELDACASKMRELIEWGGMELSSIDAFYTRSCPIQDSNYDEASCVNPCFENLQRLRPNGVTRLGHYIGRIREILRARFKTGTIVDFGCGAWIDASAYLAMGHPFTVQLVDVLPKAISFASYQLHRRGIPYDVTLVKDEATETDLIRSDAVMIVESTSFEHVPRLSLKFESLMSKLPPGGLFLTNFTRLNWSNLGLDGFQENKDFSARAVEIATKMAHRYTWEPEQVPGDGWDLWEMRG